MYKSLIVLVAAIIACHAVPTTSRRDGSFNRYYGFSILNDREPIVIVPSNITTAEEVIFPTRNTTIIVHGHRGSVSSSLNPTVKDAFLRTQDINIIVVDWSVQASQTYSVALAAVPSVGVYLANLITELVNAELVTLQTLHLVGFDLGAHVVGFTGRTLNGRVARITGLSPAGSNWGPGSMRLNKNDARYVEIIHTDVGGLFGHGISDAVGHVDFFVNGGSGQPGCFANNMCSHNRAWEVFAATVEHNHLIGNKCDNRHQVSINRCRGFTLAMGNNAFIKHGTGIFRVNTRRSYPY